MGACVSGRGQVSKYKQKQRETRTYYSLVTPVTPDNLNQILQIYFRISFYAPQKKVIRGWDDMQVNDDRIVHFG